MIGENVAPNRRGKCCEQVGELRGCPIFRFDAENGAVKFYRLPISRTESTRCFRDIDRFNRRSDFELDRHSASSIFKVFDRRADGAADG